MSSIPLQIQVPRIQSPLESMARAMTLRDLANRQQIEAERLKSLQAENAERAQAAQQLKAFNEAVKANTIVGPDGVPKVNHAGVMGALAQSGAAEPLLKYQDYLSKLEKEKLDEEAKAQQQRANNAKEGAALLLRVTDANGWEAVKPQMQKLGFDPSVMGDWDPKKRDSYIASGLGAEAGARYLQSIAEDERKKREFEATLPGKQAESTAKQLQTAGQQLAGAPTPESYQATLATLPEGLQRLFMPSFSPEAIQHANTVGMTPEQRASGEFRNTTFKETQRHNKAMEQAENQRNSLRGGEASDRRNQSRWDRLTRYADSIDKDEQKQWQIRATLGDLLNNPNDTTVIYKGKIVPLNDQLRKQIQSEFDAATKEAQRLHKVKLNTLAEIGKIPSPEGTSDSGQQSAPAPAPEPAPSANPQQKPQVAQSPSVPPATRAPAPSANPQQKPQVPQKPSSSQAPQGSSFTVRLPDELAKKIGKPFVTFPSRKAAEDFARAAGLSLR